MSKILDKNSITQEDIDAIEKWWVEKSRVNFLAYRKFMRFPNFLNGWFIQDLSRQLQQFYLDMKSGKRPILLIQSPPQHGKSWAVSDFICWMTGKMPDLRTIYATYSDTLSVRCNLAQQRSMRTYKYNQIFPHVFIGDKQHGCKQTTSLLEYINIDGLVTNGQFRNTTTGGPVTGESLDLGVIDDVVKGREQANSMTWSQKLWDWFNDDFGTRFSERAGLLVVMTRWTTHDIIGRMLEVETEFGSIPKVVNYSAIAEADEEYRKAGDPLFPELKSKQFLLSRKEVMAASSWDSLYQGNPTITGGNIFKEEWWEYYTALPLIKYRIIYGDTQQKTETQHDYSVFECWGMGNDGRIYLLDMIRDRWESPQLLANASAFWNKHKAMRSKQLGSLRKFKIEDKVSGTGLIQQLRQKPYRIPVEGIPREKDKVTRAMDVAPQVEVGNVVLPANHPLLSDFLTEARTFPNGTHDDTIDPMMDAVNDMLISTTFSSYGEII